METINPNITPEGNFRLNYFPYAKNAEPHTPLEEAIQFLFDCWNYDQVYRPWTRKTKKQLLNVIKHVLLPACKEGNQDAIYWMYYAYLNGIGVEEDADKALKYLTMIADYGYPDMQYELGCMYCRHDSPKMSWTTCRRKAVRWFRKAARQGHMEAMCYLGECCQRWHVRKSDRRSFMWYKRAAESGDEEAMLNLGLYYQRGIGVKKDLAIAVEWYDKAGAHNKDERLRNGEDEFADDDFSPNSVTGFWCDDSLLPYPSLELDDDVPF